MPCRTAHARVGRVCLQREAVQSKGGYAAHIVTSATVKFRRTVDRVWVLLLGFVHFTMSCMPSFGPNGLKTATWNLCLGVGKKYNIQGLSARPIWDTRTDWC